MTSRASPSLPRISIVIPSYNSAGFIGAAIDSVLAQEYPNTEILLVDGGSTDGTMDLVRQYGDAIAWAVSEPDRGQSDALNKGFAQSTGDLMAWLCSNDFYQPGAFASAVRFFQENPEAEFVWGDGFEVDEQGAVLSRIIDGPEPATDLRDFNYLVSTSAFWKRSLWEKAGAHIDEANYYTMDWELFLRMSRHARLHFVPEVLACFRIHGDSKTVLGCSADGTKRDAEIVAIARKYGGRWCANSVAGELKRFAGLHRHFRFLPRVLYSLIFRALHLPVVLMGRYRRPLMILGHRGP